MISVFANVMKGAVGSKMLKNLIIGGVIASVVLIGIGITFLFQLKNMADNFAGQMMPGVEGVSDMFNQMQKQMVDSKEMPVIVSENFMEVGEEDLFSTTQSEVFQKVLQNSFPILQDMVNERVSYESGIIDLRKQVEPLFEKYTSLSESDLRDSEILSIFTFSKDIRFGVGGLEHLKNEFQNHEYSLLAQMVAIDQSLEVGQNYFKGMTVQQASFFLHQHFNVGDTEALKMLKKRFGL